MGAGDSKLAFRAKINQLIDTQVLSNDHDFWKELFTSQLTVHDMFGLLTPEDIRKIRQTQPGNAQLILYKLKNPSYDHTSAVNSLRLLSRTLPFLMEHDTDSLIENFFFQNKMYLKVKSVEKIVPQVVTLPEQPKTEQIETVEQKSEIENVVPEPVKVETVIKEQIITHVGSTALDGTLAQFTITTLIEALFLPAFTIPVGQKEEKGEVVYDKSVETELIWDGGLCVSSYGRSASPEQIANRVECIRTLLALFCQPLYFRASEMSKCENKFLSMCLSNKTPHLPTVLYSLLNVILNYNPAGSLPYSSQLFSDANEELVEYSCHLLSILVHHKREDNEFLAHIKSMTQNSDFSKIYTAVTVLLGNIVASNNTYLPNSQKMFDCYEEVLIIFWKLLEENKAFKQYVCKDADVTQVLIPILYLIQSNRTDPIKFPLVQLSCFLLLCLSGCREFGVSLNRSFDIKVPLEYPTFQGTYGELMILVLHKVIVSDKGLIRPLFDCMLTIICNVSPYLKAISMVGCSKLIGLFEAFASKKFLYSSEKNHQYAFLLIETFNNLIQYQYEGSVHLVYSILRRKDSFLELAKKPDMEEIGKLLAKKTEDKKDEEMKEIKEEKNQVTVSKKLFVPTEEWIENWRSKLPIKTILTLIKIMVPEVEKLCNGTDVATEEDVLVYLKKTTLVGLLPVPHTIVIRTFQSNPLIDVFLTTYIWGLIYLRTLNPTLFDKSSIQLFTINVIE